MNKKHWDLVKEVVDTALTYSGAERDTYLNTIYDEMPAIVDEVKEMLSLIEESQQKQFMLSVRKDGKDLIAELDDESTDIIEEKYIGKKIGRYLITELIDIGGMGMVFKGERADGEFSQEVAVKILKKGLDTEENIHRFRMEREILSALNHPNIAQIYDGGITHEGLPYLVMEMIEGSPIDEYCNSHKLTVDKRLALFRQICLTVDYAHKNLVIHRDLKAPNIFVTTNGTIKILDFGIAKLLDRTNPNIDLLETMPGRKIWTPQYASPEQIKGEPVTTSTDVYALGVLLHYLLTDAYPIDLKEKSIHEIEQLILKEEPEPPSRSIVHSSRVPEIAESRSVTPTTLVSILKNDLDFLVLKSLRKEPEHRYDSASRLIEELDRYESGKPLMAKSDSVRYRTHKFIKRNRGKLAAAALFLVSVIGFTFVYTWNIAQERNIAQIEREKAEQVADFLTDLFSAGNPVSAQGEMLTAVDLLEIGIERADDLSDQPLVQAEMLYTIGSSFRGMVMPDKAIPVLEKALDLQRVHLPPDHPDIAFTLNALGSVHWSVDDDDKAEPYLREALEMRKRLHGSSHPDVFTSLNNYALVLKDLDRMDEAENIHRENLEARIAYYGPVHSKVTYSLNNLAFLLVERGKFDEAEQLYREGLEAVRRIRGEGHSDLGIFYNNLGNLLFRQGELDEAEEMLRESIRIRQRVYGENHRNVSRSLNLLANVLTEKNDFKGAEAASLRSLQIQTATHENEDHNDIATILEILGRIYWRSGEMGKAEEYYSESLQMHKNLYPGGNTDLARSYNMMGIFYLNAGRPDDAVPKFSEALAMYRKVSPNRLFSIAYVQNELGKALLEMGNFPESEAHLLNAYNYFSQNAGISSSDTIRTLERLITLYQEWGKQEQAKQFENQLAGLETDPD